MRADLAATASVRDIVHHPDNVLLPQMTAQEAIAAFDRTEAEALAVVDTPERRQVDRAVDRRRMRCAAIPTPRSGSGASCWAKSSCVAARIAPGRTSNICARETMSPKAAGSAPVIHTCAPRAASAS